MKKTDNVLLVILDGWGHGQKAEASAIAQAETPFVDSLYVNYPASTLVTFGEEVGLPEGQMGNSEVGHLNIGAGRIVYQELARINKAIRDKNLYRNPVLVQAMQHAKANNKALHFMGLLSDGGVHSHINHLKALCDMTKEEGVEHAYIHAFLDGRDTDPRGGYDYLKDILTHTEGSNVNLASVIGRYYAMDRDNRWERIQKAYNLMVHGTGEPCEEVLTTVKKHYDAGTTDEFMPALVCQNEAGQPQATIKDGDVLICFNFRTDRPREISTVLTQKDMHEYNMAKLDLYYVTMTKYDDSFKNVKVVFEKDDIELTLGEVLEKADKTQVRIAETEKYPHVTFFFNGGRETPFEGESRILIPSPKVATYDLQPEMSALEITEQITQAIREKTPNFICLNYANADMVGHTGDFKAAMKAAETVDACLKTLLTTALHYNYHAIVIADHGNSDYMINEDGSPNTAHTTNLVPCIYVAKDTTGTDLKAGKLADIAPTILSLLGVDIPSVMDGEVLLKNV